MKVFWIISSLCFALMGSSCSLHTNKAAHIGVMVHDYEADPFFGIYNNKRFIEQEPHIVANSFPHGSDLPGITEQGQNIKITIENDSASGEVSASRLFVSKVDNNTIDRHNNDEIALFWTPPIEVSYLEPLNSRIDPRVEALLKKKGHNLWEDALNERLPDKRAHTIIFGKAKVKKVEGADAIVTIYFTAIEDYGNGYIDDRASAFFIYNLQAKKVIFATFGHPEWSPSSKRVLTVAPRIFFQIKDDSHIYFVGEHSLAWNHRGFAIFELKTGNILLKNF